MKTRLRCAVCRFPASNNPAIFAAQKTLVEAWTIVQEAFVDGRFGGADWEQALSTALIGAYEAPNADKAYVEISSMLAKLGDPFTRIVPASYALAISVSCWCSCDSRSVHVHFFDDFCGKFAACRELLHSTLFWYHPCKSGCLCTDSGLVCQSEAWNSAHQGLSQCAVACMCREYADFRVSSDGEVQGVGLLIAADPTNGKLVVLAPITGGPADRAGIKPGDEVCLSCIPAFAWP